MVVRIRLQRHGRIYRPFYRVAVADSTRHVSKKVIDYLGTYDPLIDKLGNKHLRLNIPRVKYWIAVGAQPSDTVKRLLAQFKILPSPPRRTKGEPPANAELMRAMQGRGGSDEVKGEEEGQEGKQIRPSWVFQSNKSNDDENKISSAIRFNSHFPRFAHRLLPKNSENAEESQKQRKPFPFTIEPTPNTLNAWQSAKQRYNRYQPTTTTTTETTSSSSSQQSSTESASV